MAKDRMKIDGDPSDYLGMDDMFLTVVWLTGKISNLYMIFGLDDKKWTPR